MSDRVAYRLHEGVATITMDDGKVNVMSCGMLRDLDAVDQFRWSYVDNMFPTRAAVVARYREALGRVGADHLRTLINLTTCNSVEHPGLDGWA